MATYISYQDLVTGKPGAEAYWSMQETQAPIVDHVGNGGDVVDNFPGLGEGSIFDYSQVGVMAPHSKDTAVLSPAEAPMIDNINAAQELTVNLFLRTLPNVWAANNILMFCRDDAGPVTGFQIRGNDKLRVYYGGSLMEYPLPIDKPTMLSIVFSGGTYSFYKDGVLIDTKSGSLNLSYFNFFTAYGYGKAVASFGWGSIHSSALTRADLVEMLARRTFQGKIAGTVELDGAPSSATIRAFRRSDGHLAGQATASADGSYELTVLDNVQMDLLAIPPDGVAARPLAHGPILPKPYD